MKCTKSNCIRIDWKEDINETVSLLNQKWTEHESIFSDSKFKLLIDNYNSPPAGARFQRVLNLVALLVPQ